MCMVSMPCTSAAAAGHGKGKAKCCQAALHLEGTVTDIVVYQTVRQLVDTLLDQEYTVSLINFTHRDLCSRTGFHGLCYSAAETERATSRI